MSETPTPAPLAPEREALPAPGRDVHSVILAALTEYAKTCGPVDVAEHRVRDYMAECVAEKLTEAGFPAHLGHLEQVQAELDAERERSEKRRKRMAAAEGDLQDIRGLLAPSGAPRRVPMELGERVAPAVEWLLAEVERLRGVVDMQSSSMTALSRELETYQRLESEREGNQRVDQSLAAVANRRVAELNREVERLRARATELEQQTDAARAVHRKHDDSPHCRHDGEPWPCPTLTALDAAAMQHRPAESARALPGRAARCARPGCGHSGADHHHANARCWANLPRERKPNGTWGPIRVCECSGFTADTGEAGKQG